MRNTDILIPLKLKILSKLVKVEYNFFCKEYDWFILTTQKTLPNTSRYQRFQKLDMYIDYLHSIYKYVT